MKLVYAAALASSLAFVDEAAAQQVTAFKIGAVAIEGSLPAGFCTPTGDAIEKARIGAAADTGNVTHATFYSCAQMRGGGRIDDYFLIKTPSNLLDTELAREEVLTQLTAEFDDPNFSEEKLSRQAGEEASKGISKASGTATEVTTDIRPLGRDKDCAYMGGIVAASTAEGSFALNVAGCITAVGDRMVMVFRYAKGTNVAGAAALLPDARKLAMALRVK
ncbi:hypothetical protein [Sphingomonas soli]|uniref:hypothetical protein n=1 Tax=Sphingomonas soli TaxID=266127 RepID=UPI00082DF51C|nr:hypothetical protein [Sphingomonas soli]